jgi:actin-like ATPase involved in cell morphogenesis/uncharacterized protein YlaN (UPF0358 family)
MLLNSIKIAHLTYTCSVLKQNIIVMTAYPHDVFLSYAREDLEFAQKLCDELRRNGISVWLDENKLLGGEHWIATIREEISRCYFFLALISSKSVDKQGFVQSEIKQAIDIQRSKPTDSVYFIPVRIDDCKIPYPELLGVHAVDMSPNYDRGLNRLIQIIWKQKSEINLEIVGFDLGHGETAVAVTRSSSSSQPQVLDINGKNSIMTAVAINSEGIVIGEDVYEVGNSDKLFILFKNYQVCNPQVREPIIFFVKKYLEILETQRKLKLDQNTWFFVGSPSGWTEDDRKEYAKVFREAGMTNVIVRPESRAAFLDAKETGVLNRAFEQLADSVLIIDIGSSTTDFTLVRNYEESPLDFGHNDLGGGLIDIEIFNRSLSLLPTESREHILKKIAENSNLKTKCILKCREVKEKFFSRDIDHWEETPSRGTQVLDEDDDLEFKVKIYRKDMEEILGSPIEKLGKTWSDAFRDNLQRCQESPEFQPLKLILMTGGGSRMKFAYDICKEEFPETEVLIGLDPALTVAKGLALAGRIDFKIKGFRAEVDSFIESEALSKAIVEKLPWLVDKTTDAWVDKFSEIAKRNYMQWMQGHVATLSDMERRIYSEANEYFTGEAYSDIERDADEWLRQVSVKIEPLTHSICDRYRISRATFNLSIGKMVPYSIELGGLISVSTTKDVLVRFISGSILGISALGIFISLGGNALILIVDFLRSAGIIKGVSDMTEEQVKDFEIATFARTYLLPENDFDKEMEEIRLRLKQEINQKVCMNLRSKENLDKIFACIKDALNKRADEAEIVIKTLEKVSL